MFYWFWCFLGNLWCFGSLCLLLVISVAFSLLVWFGGLILCLLVWVCCLVWLCVVFVCEFGLGLVLRFGFVICVGVVWV